MHKRVRRHSALLLLLAPVVAIGSSFLVAGTANAAVKTAKSVKPTITVCDSVQGSFHFSINGKLMSLSKQCVAVTARAGINHVVETWAPASYRNLESVTVSPSSARVSASAETASATIRLSAHGAATVRFVNAKVVTQVINRATGRASTGTGDIKVCKYSADTLVEGTFPFTISAGGTVIASVTAPLGGCSAITPVPAGTVTVTEGNEFPYEVTAVTSLPTLAVSGIVTGAIGSANFVVGANQGVEAQFVDGTYLGYYEACKVLTDNQGSLAGQVFTYTAKWSFTPPNGAATITGSSQLSLTAVASPGQACSYAAAAPAGSTVTITENALPGVYVAVTNVAVSVGKDLGSGNGTAVMEVPTDGSFAAATFTNDPLGVIEVCKNFIGDSPFLNYNKENSAAFSVNGGPDFWVNGGECSAPIVVPAGTATVTEASQTNFFVWNVSTQSATDVFGTRLLTGDTVNPASVTVPYGGVGNETVVTFTDAVDPTQFKICKQQTSPDANLQGDTFNFTYGWDDGEFLSGEGSVSLTLPAIVTASNPTDLVCSGLIWGPPVVDPSGNAINVNITEEATTDPSGVQLDSITYQGGSTYQSSDPALPLGVVAIDSDLPADPTLPGPNGGWICIDPGAGINVVTFTNGRTPTESPT
ncbi:MAG: hypothetical protein ABSG36_12460 [Acidimicrobiales bacterium]